MISVWLRRDQHHCHIFLLVRGHQLEMLKLFSLMSNKHFQIIGPSLFSNPCLQINLYLLEVNKAIRWYVYTCRAPGLPPSGCSRATRWAAASPEGHHQETPESELRGHPQHGWNGHLHGQRWAELTSFSLKFINSELSVSYSSTFWFLSLILPPLLTASWSKRLHVFTLSS